MVCSREYKQDDVLKRGRYVVESEKITRVTRRSHVLKTELCRRELKAARNRLKGELRRLEWEWWEIIIECEQTNRS